MQMDDKTYEWAKRTIADLLDAHAMLHDMLDATEQRASTARNDALEEAARAVEKHPHPWAASYIRTQLMRPTLDRIRAESPQVYAGRAHRDPLAAVRQAIDAEYQRWGDSVSPESQGARQALAHIAAVLS